MYKKYVAWVVFGLVLIASAGLVGYGWQLSRQASVVVEWSTASELDTVGFNVYRGERAEGPFDLITSQLIPSSADPLVGGEYSYVDRGVVPGHTYFYLLEDISSNGVGGRHGPIEVVAQAGGMVELALGGILLGVALFGLRPARKPGEALPRIARKNENVQEPE